MKICQTPAHDDPADDGGPRFFPFAARRAAATAVLAASGAFVACGGGGSGSGGNLGGTSPGGETQQLNVGDGPVFSIANPGPNAFGFAADFTYPADFAFSPAGFFVAGNEDDEIADGEAADPKLLSIRWGRLVDIVVPDPVTGDDTLYHRDFIIGEDIYTDNADYVLETNPITQRTVLRILHQPGTAEYQEAFGRLDDNLGLVLNKHPEDAPPFSFFPRNSAAILTFSDLIDHTTVSAESVRVRVGSPPTAPFEARIVPDPNYGAFVDGANGKEFRSSRVIVDMTVSEVEAQGTTIAVNSLGLPASASTAVPNVAIYIPTKPAPSEGIFQILHNTSAHPLTILNNGPVDLAATSKDVVRAFRSGGDGDLTGDSNNGFLLDLNSPRIVGSQAVTVLNVLSEPVADTFELTLQFEYQLCQQVATKGDVLELPGVFAEVLSTSSSPSGGIVSGVRVRVLSNEGAGSSPIFPGASGQFSSAFKEGDIPDCFVSFSPNPVSPPVTGVKPSSQLTIRFSEPMDPISVNAFDTFVIGRESIDSGGGGINDLIVGHVLATPDLREYRFVPLVPFAHNQTVADEYFIRLGAGAGGPTDLGGNAIIEGLDEVPFQIEANAPSEFNGSIVLRFALTGLPGIDEDGVPGDEIAGQFLLDAEREVLQARPVSRFPAVADRTQAVPSIMIPFLPGVQTPLSPLGSKLMTLYRYFDVGFSVDDVQNHNIDIEGISWSPIGGQIINDSYEQFEISLAHSKFLPDEVINPASLLPSAPNSGLNAQAFLNNVMDDPLNELTVVHPREKGYAISPLDLFTSSTGTTLVPYPLNRTGDPEEFVYYTWRDWRIRGVGCPSGNGIDPAILVNVGLATEAGGEAAANFVPSYGQPLLMEFKCYPDDNAIGLNAFDISLAINSSAKPQFRIFSTGGYNQQQVPVQKNPDAEIKPSGGFNPGSNPPGKTTKAMDNSFYMGQLDIVTRVSIVYTRFLNADDDPSPDYLDPVIEPIAEDQPLGTQVLLSYRGASSSQDLGDGAAHLDAAMLDEYGDLGNNDGSGIPGDPAQKNNGLTYHPDPFNLAWNDEIDDVDGARFLQVRFTFISNPISNLAPELTAIGVAFNKSGV